MEKVFINFTNHPSEYWDETQKNEAQTYGDIVDVPFPHVDAHMDEPAIHKLAEEYVEKLISLQPEAVLCQGEFCLAYEVIRMLKERGIRVLAACSQRDVVEQKKEDGSMEKKAIFRFVKFRAYGD